MAINSVAIAILIAGLHQTEAHGVETNLFREQRLVRDLTSFHIEEIRAGSSLWWIVGRLSPSSETGAKAAGAYIEDGKLVFPPGTHIDVTVQGTIVELQSFDGPHQQSVWEYSWEFRPRARHGEDRELYSPFRSGGVAILGIRGDAGNEVSFARVVLVPEEWVDFVPTAIQFWRANEGDVDRLINARDMLQLQALLRHDNPLVRLFVFRDALRGDVGGAGLQRIALSQRGIEQALSTFLLLSHHSRMDFAKAFEQVLRDAASLESIQGAVLGAFAALRYGESQDIRALAREVLESIRNRLAELERRGEAEEYVSKILNAAGTRRD